MSDESEDHRLLVDESARSLFEEASDGVFLSNADGVYLEVNRSGHRLLGYPYGELVGKSVFEVILPRDVPQLTATLEAVLQGTPRTQIWSMVKKDQSLAELEVMAQRLKNGAVLAIVRELSSRSDFERAIQASEAKLRSILQTAPDTIMSVDRQGLVLFINRTQAPYTPEQVVGTSCYDYVPPAARPRVKRAIEHVFTKRTIDEYEVEGRLDSEGMSYWVAVRAGPLIERGEVVAATLCATDITYRKQAESTRAKLEEQLRHAQRMESVGQLAGGVAHDFNNLLTAVVALVELTREGLPPDVPAQEHLDGILAASARGATLTQQLLAFARRKLVQPENADLGAILTRMVPMVRRLVGEHINVELVLAPELGAVLVDVGSLEQVIMNLIVNARDAMPDGGNLVLETESVVWADSGRESRPGMPLGRYALLRVTDTGTGMTPEVRARLFEPFFTTKELGAGTGLGLAMCHGIVEQAGGSIEVTSEPGRGTSFLIHLPVAVRSAPQPVSSIPPGVASSGRETLLLVEDEPMILRVVRSALQKLGYRVYSASDGVEALEVAAQLKERIDLLVTDMVMPRLGGRELAIRLQELRPETRVLYTSGYAGNASTYQGVLTEGVNFIQKPYSLAALAQRVRQMLDRP